MGKRKIRNDDIIRPIHHSTTERYGMYVIKGGDKYMVCMLLGYIPDKKMLIFYNDPTRSVMLYDEEQPIGEYKADYLEIRTHRLSALATEFSKLPLYIWLPKTTEEHVKDVCNKLNCYVILIHNTSKRNLIDIDSYV